MPPLPSAHPTGDPAGDCSLLLPSSLWPRCPPGSIPWSSGPGGLVVAPEDTCVSRESHCWKGSDLCSCGSQWHTCYLCGFVGVSMGFFLFQFLCTLHVQFCKRSCTCEYLCISVSLNLCALCVGCEIVLCLDVFVCIECSDQFLLICL